MAEVTEEQLAELERKRAAAREALVRDRQEREAAAQAEKAAFEERANAAREAAERKRKQKEEEYEAREKWQKEHEREPVGKSQKELSDSHYSQFKSNPPANSQQKSAMHEVAETAVEEHEAAKESNYLSHVERTKEIERKREEAHRKANPKTPGFEKKYQRESAREEATRQTYEPVENEVVTTTIVEASSLGKTRTHVPANPPIERTSLPIFTNAAIEKTGREIPPQPQYTGADAIPFDVMNTASEKRRSELESKKQKIAEHEANKNKIDFEGLNAASLKKKTEMDVKKQQIDTYLKKQEEETARKANAAWSGDIDTGMFSNQQERAKANQESVNREIRTNYEASSRSQRGTMGILKDILTHPHDTAQEIGYAAEKKVGQHIMERRQAKRDIASKQLEPEYTANDQKLREGKISREMHELRAKQLDQKFEKMSTPIEQRVGRGVAREATSIFDISQGKPGAKESNSIVATFARGVEQTSEKMQKQSDPIPNFMHGALAAPSRKEFGGGKGTRKSSPTKGTVVSKGKNPGINFGMAGFGSPIAFGDTIARSPALVGGLFGRGQPAPAPAPAPKPRHAPRRKR